MVRFSVSIQQSSKDALCRKVCLHSLAEISVSTENSTIWVIVASNYHLTNSLLEVRRDSLISKTNSQHSTVGVDIFNNFPAIISKNNGFGCCNRASGISSSDLARGMPTSDGYSDTPKSQKLNKGDLDRPAERLRELGLVDSRSFGVFQESIPQSPIWRDFQSSSAISRCLMLLRKLG